MLTNVVRLSGVHRLTTSHLTQTLVIHSSAHASSDRFESRHHQADVVASERDELFPVVRGAASADRPRVRLHRGRRVQGSCDPDVANHGESHSFE